MEKALEKILNKLNEMEVRNTRIENKLDKLNVEITELQKEQTVINHEIQELKIGKETILKRLTYLEKRMENNEKREKEKNVIITGVKVRQESVKEDIEHFLHTNLNIDTNIEEAKLNISRRQTPYVIVKLKNVEDKKRIMKEKRKLKGTKMFIDEDRTAEERKTQMKIKEKADKEKSEGKKVRMGFKKLWIEDQLFIWDEKKQEIRRRDEITNLKN